MRAVRALDLVHSSFAIPAQPVGSSTDPLARWLALAGLVVAALSLLRGWRESLWRRRASLAGPLRTYATEIADRLAAAAQSPSGALGLWSPATSFALEAMSVERTRIPDRELRRLLEVVHGDVLQARGLKNPSIEDSTSGDPPSLTDVQMRAVDQARDRLRKVDQRLDKIARKGGQVSG